HDSDLKVALETSARGELKNPGTRRDYVLLRQARFVDRKLPAARLPFLEPCRPRLGTDVVHAAQGGRNVRIGRVGGEHADLLRDGGIEQVFELVRDDGIEP